MRTELDSTSIGIGSRTAEEVLDACVAARVPAAIVGNGAELPRFDQLVERGVYVTQPGEHWPRPG